MSAPVLLYKSRWAGLPVGARQRTNLARIRHCAAPEKPSFAQGIFKSSEKEQSAGNRAYKFQAEREEGSTRGGVADGAKATEDMFLYVT